MSCLLVATVLSIVHVSGEDIALVYSESHLEDEALVSSLCLLQKEINLNLHDAKDKVKTWYPATSGLLNSTAAAEYIAPPVPVDSLAVPVPVPAPAVAMLVQDRWQSAAWSLALFGMVFLWLLLLHLFGHSHKGCQQTVQTTVSNAGAFFIAKLLYAALSLFTAAVFRAKGFSEPIWEDDLLQEHYQVLMPMFIVSIIRAIILYVIFQFLVYFFCYLVNNKKRIASCIGSIGAALVSFAMVDAFAIRLRCPDTTEDFVQYVLVCIFCILCVAAVLAIHLLVKESRETFFGPLVELVTSSTREGYEQESTDFENILVSTVGGFLVYKVVERSILGEQAIARDPSTPHGTGSESQTEIAGVLIVGLILAASTSIVHTLRIPSVSQWTLGFPPRLLDWLEGCLFMGCAWCLYNGIYWTFTNGYFIEGLLQVGFTGSAMLAAFAACAFVLLVAIIVGISIASGGPSSLPQGSSGRYSCWLVMLALGLLGGFAWAACFILAARDLAAISQNNADLVEGILCAAFAIFIIPAWAAFLVPPETLASESDMQVESPRLKSASAVILSASAVPRLKLAAPRVQD